jgi:hypothetical protein
VRVRDLDASMVLSDAMGPWIRAAASPWNTDVHAAPYGPGLHLHLRAALEMADSLREALTLNAALHSLAAPLAVLVATRLGGWSAGLSAGVLVALDPGLVDTTLSGAEGYAAPMWIGVAVLLAQKRSPQAAFLAPLALALAVHNHVLSLCALPFLVPIRPRIPLLAGLAIAGVLCAPMISSLQGQVAGMELALGEAADAWADQGGWAALTMAGCAVLALLRQHTRMHALALLVSVGLLGAAGNRAGYLRDHHLRLLTVPLAGCLAALPTPLRLLPLAYPL